MKLVPHTRYLVTSTIEDFYGHRVEAGETLTFRERSFLPYDGGHTLVFAERKVYLQETEQAEQLALGWLEPT